MVVVTGVEIVTGLGLAMRDVIARGKDGKSWMRD